MEQEMLTFSGHIRSNPVFSVVRVVRSFFGHCIVCPIFTYSGYLFAISTPHTSSYRQTLYVQYRPTMCDRLILFVCLMVLNATFNTNSVISWLSVLLVEETGWPGEIHRPVASHWQTLSHSGVNLNLVEIGTHNISGDRHWLHRL